MQTVWAQAVIVAQAALYGNVVRNLEPIAWSKQPDMLNP
jgi:hypothetical protein